MRRKFSYDKERRQVTFGSFRKVALSVVLAATVVVSQSAYTVNVLAASVEDCDLDGFDDYTGNPVPWIGFDSTKGQEIPSDWDGHTTYKSKKDYEDAHKKQEESKTQTSVSSGSSSDSASSSSNSSTTKSTTTSNTTTNKTTSSSSATSSSASKSSTTKSSSKSSSSSQKSSSSKSSSAKKSAAKSTDSKKDTGKNTDSKSNTAEEKNTVEKAEDSVKDNQADQEQKKDKKQETVQDTEETETDTIQVADNTQEVNAGQEEIVDQQDIAPIQEAEIGSTEEIVEDSAADGLLLDEPKAQSPVADSFLKALTVGFSSENKGLIPGVAILIALAAGGIVTVLFSSILGRK